MAGSLRLSGNQFHIAGSALRFSCLRRSILGAFGAQFWWWSNLIWIKFNLIWSIGALMCRRRVMRRSDKCCDVTAVLCYQERLVASTSSSHHHHHHHHHHHLSYQLARFNDVFSFVRCFYTVSVCISARFCLIVMTISATGFCLRALISINW